MADNFPLYATDAAPQEARGVMRAMTNKYGFELNQFAKLATSPMTLRGYVGLAEVFAKSTLTPFEQQIVLLTVSAFHGGDYCVAAHATTALTRKMPAELIEAIKNGEPLANHRLEALRHFTRTLVEQRGAVEEVELETFLVAGYRPEQALEVILGIALKTLSNYANQLMATPIDERFAENDPKQGD